MTERTLILVKPDGVQRGLIGDVLSRIEGKGLRIVAMDLRTLDRDTAELHYAEHSVRPFFGQLVDFITSGPLVALVVEGPRAIEAFRVLAGLPTRSALRWAPSAEITRWKYSRTSCTDPTRRRPLTGKSRSFFPTSFRQPGAGQRRTQRPWRALLAITSASFLCVYLRAYWKFGTRAAGTPVSYGSVQDGELVFVPGEIPRQGVFALWGRGAGSAKLELVFPGGRYGIRKRLVSADLIPLAEALPGLLAAGSDERPGRPMRRSVRVWAAAAAAGVGLVARGRLLPTVGADDTDVWRAGPLDPSDLSWLRELAAVFPPTAHALAIPGSRPMRLRSPEALIRDLWDAIADLVARSPAAPRTTASTAFAAAEPTRVDDLAEWLADTTDGLAAGARLGLRIEAVPAPRMATTR